MSKKDLEQEAYSLGKPGKQSGNPSGRTKLAKPRRRAFGIMALEPRIMYDAAAAATAATAADTHSDSGHTDATHFDPAPVAATPDPAPAVSAPSAARQDIVIIDSVVPDIQTLINAVNPGDRIFILQGNSDGVQQIADIVRDNNLHDLSSIQIVSHGGQGEVRLGSTTARLRSN
jgi:hypothetical protein